MRKLFLSLRRCIPAEEKQRADQIICERVMALPQWMKAEIICLYMSTPDEVDTKPLLAAALNAEKAVVFPRMRKDGLTIHKIISITDFTRGRFGILEPKASCQLVNLSTVNLFIVPGIAFDRKGYRLGWGKGYYDRLLASTDAPKIGLAYSYQVVAELPRTSYDIPMTMVVTEK